MVKEYNSKAIALVREDCFPVIAIALACAVSIARSFPMQEEIEMATFQMVIGKLALKA